MTVKHAFFTIEVILFILSTKMTCHLTNTTKSYEETIRYYERNDPKIYLPINDTQVTANDQNFGLTQNANSVHSEYLDDLVLALKSNNWTEEEKPCIENVLFLINSLQDFTLWAVWDWDAQASEPQGILSGSRYHLGNFDQCMYSPWSQTHPELHMKYCLAEIKLTRTNKRPRKRVPQSFSPYAPALNYIEGGYNEKISARKANDGREMVTFMRVVNSQESKETRDGEQIVRSSVLLGSWYRLPHTRPVNELTWGTCVPKSCPAQTIEKFLAMRLARSHLRVPGIKPTITVTEPCQVQNEELQFDGLFYTFVSITGLLVAITLICTYLNSKNKGKGLLAELFKAFCLKENANDLLRVKKDSVQVFYGIKFLTMCFIVLSHRVAMNDAGLVSNGLSTDKISQSFVGLLLLHTDLFVETFFLIAGFLTFTNFYQWKKFPNPLLIILKRYVRLVIGFAAVTFYVCAVYHHTGNGPLWNRVIGGDVASCRKNWWLNILMVHNYIDTKNMCMLTSWYIPCDFHLLVVSTLIFWIYKQKPILGKLLLGAIVITSILLPGIVTYVYELSAIQPFTIEFSLNPRGNRDFMLAYVKTHIRSAAYIVGAISGIIYAKYNDIYRNKKMSRVRSTMGVILALVFMFGIMISGSLFIWRDYHPLEGAVYAALNKPAWALGLILFVLSCTFGDVPIIKGFLSWYPFVPLSRLVYGLYLWHALFIVRNAYVARNPHHNDYFETVTALAGIIFWSVVAALVLWLLAEAPANKLLILCLRPKHQITSGQCLSKSNGQYSHGDSTATSGLEQIHEKSPSTAYISKL